MPEPEISPPTRGERAPRPEPLEGSFRRYPARLGLATAGLAFVIAFLSGFAAHASLLPVLARAAAAAGLVGMAGWMLGMLLVYLGTD